MAHSLQNLCGIRLLHVTSGTARPGWLANALGEFPNAKVALCEVPGAFEGMKALQTQAFDLVLVGFADSEKCLDFISGCRTGGVTVPMLILGRKREADVLTRCLEYGGDGWIPLEETTVSNLLWQISMAVEMHKLSVQNTELKKSLQKEIHHQQEASQQFANRIQSIVRKKGAKSTVSPSLQTEYLELLKTCIPLAGDAFSREIQTFGKMLAAQKTNASEVLALHANALEQLLQTPGRKNPLFLMNRANLLFFELTSFLLDHASACAETFPLPRFRPESPDA